MFSMLWRIGSKLGIHTSSVENKSDMKFSEFLQLRAKRTRYSKLGQDSLVNQYTHDQKKTSVPKTINLCWLGSMLSRSHWKRAIKWKKLNPSYTVVVWLEFDQLSKNDEQKLTQVFGDNGVNFNNITSLRGNEKYKTVYSWMDSIVKVAERFEQSDSKRHIGFVNQACRVDFGRYMILDQNPGWYFDTDIIPKPLQKICPKLGFMLNAKQAFDLVTGFSPSIIACIENSEYINKALGIIDCMWKASTFRENLLIAVHDKCNSHYLSATMLTSGMIGFYATKFMKINGQALATVNAGDTFATLNKKVATDTVIVIGERLFNASETREKSWMRSSDKSLSQEQMTSCINSFEQTYPMLDLNELLDKQKKLQVNTISKFRH